MSREVIAFQTDSIVDDKTPGAFKYFTTAYRSKIIGGLNFRCPCGCEDGFAVWFTGSKAKWKWNGNRDKPTLIPSIFLKKFCGWHGFLTNGVWVG